MPNQSPRKEIVVNITALSAKSGQPELVLVDVLKNKLIEKVKTKEVVSLTPTQIDVVVNDNKCLRLLDETLSLLDNGIILEGNFKALVNFYLRLMVLSRKYLMSINDENLTVPETDTTKLTHLLAFNKWNTNSVLSELTQETLALDTLDGFVSHLKTNITNAAKSINHPLDETIIDEYLTRIYLIGLYSAYEAHINALKLKYKDHIV